MLGHGSLFFWDALTLILYTGIIFSIGFYFKRKQETVEDFTLGNRQIPWWAVMASILAAEISAATFLGAPGEGYAMRNFNYAQLAIGTVLARLIVAYLFIKTYYDYRVVSIYEFLDIRFGPKTKNAASAVFLLTRALASGTRLYVAAVVVVLAFQMVTKVHPTPTQEILIYAVALTFLVAMTTIYTSVGGIRAVIWTDVLQASVMAAALGFAIYSLLKGIHGGWQSARQLLQQPDDLTFFNSGLKTDAGLGQQIKLVLESEYTIWAALIGSTFVTMATHGTDQDMVQRMLTAKNHHRSRLALVLSGLADIPIVMSFLLVGVLLWVFYQQHHDPNLPTKNPHVFAYYILHQLPTGARGLLVAGILATAMGSLSTALNALATSFVKDGWLPYVKRNTDEASQVRALRWSTVGFGVLLILIGCGTAWVVVSLPGSRIIPIVLGVFGYTYGSILGVFLVGMLTKARGSDFGNLLGMACGFVVVSFLSGLHNEFLQLLGLPKIPQPDWVPVIAFPWRVFFGTLTTFCVAVAFSRGHEIHVSEHEPMFDKRKIP